MSESCNFPVIPLRVRRTGSSVPLPDCGGLCFWVDDFTGKYYPPDPPILVPRQKDSLSIHFILGGRGYFYTADGGGQLGPGEAFYIRPFETVRYYPDPNDPWYYCGIACDGAEVALLLAQSGLPHSAVLPAGGVSTRLGRLLTGLMEEEREGPLSPLRMQTAFYRLLELFLPSSAPCDAAGDYVRTALAYLGENYPNTDLRISAAARAAGISHSYLCRLIRTRTGLSAERQLILIRMRAAARLLSSTSLPVGEAAWACGYTDAAHFGKAFRAMYGLSPSAYRAREAGRAAPGEA